ncbi:MAG: bifunctional folylpolyglutamate synthase/dihydrofolate synthase [Chlorobium sp.]|uniref:bifunctional folylpolyglutamate synthase/dihydrofolate synthase n=1 Tax=Chlorobium sp. TaxID=1095 RepID=UPI0025C54D30|nr:folylpolyglutamate synthase/dihydrofolate synthase family protein [Chlorobium sp.]MCF8382577.1 bifunctional folylpolyglutamate synthase/dihydrofolate synthase [Chlorobium sp.]
MNYQETLDFLYPLHRFGMKPGLERAASLLEIFGMPHKRLGTIVHIAGTNGKGTTASALAAIFQAAGKKTALYTSPHLVDFTERMRIDGVPISAGSVAAYCSAMKDRVIELQATFFEATTALAFAWFADEQVEVTIIETGMGGRLDATNVVMSDYAVITAIGLDHTAWLGTTPAMIAREKAAIINVNSRVFTAVTDSEALSEIVRAAELNQVPLFRLGNDAVLRVEGVEPGLLEFSLSTAAVHYRALQVPLTGAFHASNLSLAVMVAEAAGIAEDAVRRGLRNLLKTGYRARLEKIGSMPDVFLDVSHNADGMRETAAAISLFRHRYRAMHVLIGLASDKDASTVIRHLVPLDAGFASVTIPSERSIPASELAVLLKSEGVDPLVFDTPLEGFEHLLRGADSCDMILVTGSFFLAGEILRRKALQQQ